MNVPRVRPRVELSDGAKLLKQPADDPLAVRVSAQLIELGHDARERPFEFANRVFGVELALLINASLALDELFAVEIRKTGEMVEIREGLVARARVG